MSELAICKCEMDRNAVAGPVDGEKEVRGDRVRIAGAGAGQVGRRKQQTRYMLVSVELPATTHTRPSHTQTLTQSAFSVYPDLVVESLSCPADHRCPLSHSLLLIRVDRESRDGTCPVRRQGSVVWIQTSSNCKPHLPHSLPHHPHSAPTRPFVPILISNSCPGSRSDVHVCMALCQACVNV